ncbi:hypothetical protein CDL15_Pgr005027 [Punica granatum]|uniref:Uncharacterized protein n=1 Tax=Punica granatum TaxID=22663 RepID=A0A218WJ67_PUNGR|nr:hypothetical protein CDL15_Pgr005027 [Punica granatum]
MPPSSSLTFRPPHVRAAFRLPPVKHEVRPLGMTNLSAEIANAASSGTSKRFAAYLSQTAPRPLAVA